jgi:hypothetical protein
MARDLYGELLSRALNRGAPQGHFAAYITPQEGGALRSMGGGVPPGGGQYMANGIPSFQEAGFDDPGISNPTGPPGGLGSAGHEMGQGTRGFQPSRGMTAAEAAAVDAAEQAMGLENPMGRQERATAVARFATRRTPARALRAESKRAREATLPSLPTNLSLRDVFMQLQRDELAAVDLQTVQAPQSAETPSQTSPAAPETLHEIAARNLETINLDYRNTERRGPPGTPATYTEAGREALGRDISRGGIGSIAPGTTLANNNPTATTEDVATVNQHSDRTGGYSVNDPHSNVSVPAGMNMGLIPALAGTIAGFASPVIGLPMMMSGYPTLGRMAVNAARADTGMIGSALRGFQTNVTDPINEAFDVVTQPIENLGSFLGSGVRAGASAVGDFLNENVVDPLGERATALGEDISESLPDLPGFSIGDALSQGETPSDSFQDPQAGGNQEVFVPPQPAPITEPFVPDSTERQFAEIPPEILARILANEKFGRERIGLA